MTTREQLRQFIDQLDHDELRTLRAMINGKLSRRTLTEADRAKMQEAKKTKKGSVK